MRFAGGCASYTMYEAVPLWLISDTELGGLGMTEKSVGSFLCRIWPLEHHLFHLGLAMVL